LGGVAVSSSNFASLSVDVPTPSGATVGDVIIALITVQNKNFFSNTPALVPPSSAWELGFYNGGSDQQDAAAVFALSVTTALPSTLTFTANGDSTVSQVQMIVTLVAVEGANNSNPIDNLGYTGNAGSSMLDIHGVTTIYENDLILISASPTLNFSSWGGVVTPGTPVGTTEISLFQSESIGCSQVAYSQPFVGPGPTGDYVIPNGWNGESSSCLTVAIGAGYPNDGDIEGFEPTDNGTITPDPIITGTSTLLSAPLGMIFDASKQLWIADAQSGNLGGIFMYKSPASDTGNRPPDLVIQGNVTELLFPQDVFIDSAGKIYVANLGTDTQNGFVSIFAQGSQGNVAPTTLISGGATTLISPVGVAVDAFGSIYVIDSTQNAILVFAAGEGGNINPTRTIKGSQTLIFNPQAIRFDTAGNLWVCVGAVPAQNLAYLLQFGPGVSGNARPLSQITSAALQPLGGNGGPTGITFDTSANIFVSVYNNTTVLEFLKGASGSTLPQGTITGWSNGPWGIALPPA
jgi:hypothetical protein